MAVFTFSSQTIYQIMKKYFVSRIGRLRLIGFLEGTSLLLLVFNGVPLKYFSNDPEFVKAIGPLHGVLFVLFVINTFETATEEGWKFSKITWKILVSCMLPFGTFIADLLILKKMHNSQLES